MNPTQKKPTTYQMMFVECGRDEVVIHYPDGTSKRHSRLVPPFLGLTDEQIVHAAQKCAEDIVGEPCPTQFLGPMGGGTKN